VCWKINFLPLNQKFLSLKHFKKYECTYQLPDSFLEPMDNPLTIFLSVPGNNPTHNDIDAAMAFSFRLQSAQLAAWFFGLTWLGRNGMVWYGMMGPSQDLVGSGPDLRLGFGVGCVRCGGVACLWWRRDSQRDKLKGIKLKCPLSCVLITSSLAMKTVSDARPLFWPWFRVCQKFFGGGIRHLASKRLWDQCK